MEVVTDTQVTPEVIDELRSGAENSSGFPYQTQPFQGFQSSPGGETQRSTPSPRPRRRLAPAIVGCLLLTMVFGLMYSLWNALGRYSAYGVVTGTIVDVAAPIDGRLATLAVSEGDSVERGGPLGTIHNLELEQQLARVTDELRVAEATLLAESAKLAWTQTVMGANQQKAAAEYYEAWGRFHEENSQLGFLERDLARTRGLHKRVSLPASELDKAESEVEGQRRKLEKLSRSLEVLRERARIDMQDVASATGGSAAEPAGHQTDRTESELAKTADRQLSEARARIEALSHEVARLRQRLSEGSVTSPVDGIVIKQHRDEGERVRSPETLFSLVAADSMQIELFVPQKMAATIRVGDDLQLNLEPYSSSVECEVVRIGDRFVAAPPHLEKFYRLKAALLPVYLIPKAGLWETPRIPLGSVAKLPHRWLVD